ncbi:MAG: tetratricopeptide repeat protein [Thermostichus sp. HHBFW_bins_43]
MSLAGWVGIPASPPANPLPTSLIATPPVSSSGTAAHLNWQGSLKLLRGDSLGALEDLDRALQLDPGYAPAYVNRSYVYNQMRLPEEALADADEAIRLDAGIPEAYFSRGVAHLQLGNREAAMADFREAMALFSKSGNFADQTILQQLLRQLGVDER